MVQANILQSIVADNMGGSTMRGYWSEEITKAQKRYRGFQADGDKIHDRYQLERESEQGGSLYQDRYNILYSSTETTKPSLYVQTPKVQAVRRHKDRTNDNVVAATMILEACGQYAIEEVDFDGVLKNAVQDYLLPGLGVAWVRYEAGYNTKQDTPDSEEYEEIAFQGLGVDYVHYKDFLTGVGRTWHELPWVARRVYFNKAKATKRFGAEKANLLSYSYRPDDDGNANKGYAGTGGWQTIIYEIWDRTNKQVVWYSDDYMFDVLDQKSDPLKLDTFFPCPEPMRAVWLTRTFIPKGFYSQYKAQAEELDNLTERIRHLTKAIRAVGVYDGSQEQLQNILSGNGNKMVAVQNWALFAQQGGIAGSIQWLPIKEIADVLMNLLQQRDTVKGEIYEITGFSDIQRGVSKASETLGAQKIKSDWASGRLKDMQKEVQRFCRDIIRIMAEIMSEHFNDASLALYAGFDPPPVSPQEQQAAAQYAQQKLQYIHGMMAQQSPMPGMQPQAPMQPPQPPPPTQQQQAIQAFQSAIALIRNEKKRAAMIGIETDSTLLPDEQAERQDRMDFLGAAGAFLQQAGPLALQYPDMRALLGSILMFTIRTFPASRPLEKDFEDFQQKLSAAPPMPPAGQGGEGKGGDPQGAQAKVQSEQIKAQSAQDTAQQEGQLNKYEIDTKAGIERDKMGMEHQYRMAELGIRSREATVKEKELGIDAAKAHADTALAANDQRHSHAVDLLGHHQQERQFAASRQDAGRDFQLAQQQASQSQNQG